MLSGRQINILQFLNSQNQYVTMTRIAEEMEVSSKTVRNDLAGIREYCTGIRLGGVETKPHAGVRSVFSQEEWERFSDNIQRESSDELSSGIQDTIIMLLLKRQSVNFNELEKRLYIGRNTIEKALPQVKKWFQSHDILYEKKRGKGMEITYTEYHWRLAMWNFVRYGNLPIQDELESRAILEKLLDGFDINGVELAVEAIEHNNQMVLGYEAHLQLVFLLALGVIRTRKRCIAEIPITENCKIDSVYDINLAGELAARLEDYYQICIPSLERSYILFAVKISDIQKFMDERKKRDFQIQNLELSCLTVKLVSLLGEIINIDLKSDVLFMETLMIQLRSTIQRLKYHISMPHPLLNQVKQKYPNIFAAIYAAGVFFDKELGLEINENEMCYLALFLGGALERNIATLTTCVVCNYGIGVSQLLKEMIERNITDLKILDVFSVRDIHKIRNLCCDFIISTLPLEEPCGGKDVIVVEHLLPAYDVKKISDKMKQVRRQKLKTKVNCNVLEIKKELFHKDFVWIKLRTQSRGQLINQMCRALIDAGYVTEEFEESVLEHEEMAPTQLGKGVAIPHGYAKYVIRPVVAYASLELQIIWEERELVDIVFLLAFNLDEVSGMKEETIKFYSIFLDILDNEEELNFVRKIMNGEALVDYMNQKVRGELAI